MPPGRCFVADEAESGGQKVFAGSGNFNFSSREFYIMKRKIAFAGFRHNHIFSLYARVAGHSELEICGACEEYAPARTRVKEAHPEIDFNYDCLDAMIAGSGCDIVAVGDYYGRRGAIAIAALRQGKSVISDKPLCTSLGELEEIERLVAAAPGKLAVGCMLDLRTGSAVAAARNFIDSGRLGKIVQIQFTGQHPLLYGSRPEWYFEAGKHGGTINDIAIHGIDIVRRLTGSEVARILAARSRRALAPVDFRDSGSLMLELDSGCCVLADVSYSAPDSQGYGLPSYWRFNIWGEGGMIEFNSLERCARAYLNGESALRLLEPPADPGPDYLDSFLNELDGRPGELNTAEVIASSRSALRIQQVADAEMTPSSSMSSR